MILCPQPLLKHWVLEWASIWISISSVSFLILFTSSIISCIDRTFPSLPTLWMETELQAWERDTQVPLYMVAMYLTRRTLQWRVTLGRPPTLQKKNKSVTRSDTRHNHSFLPLFFKWIILSLFSSRGFIIGHWRDVIPFLFGRGLKRIPHKRC